MQPPGLFQEQAAVTVDSLLASEEVVQRRDVRPLGMGALHRLLELSRIAEQNDACSRMRNCEHVGQRHLCRFVNKYDIYQFDLTVRF